MLLNYLASMLLIALGLYTIIAKRHLIKTVIGIGLIDYGINLLIITIGYNPGGTAPIFTMEELAAGSYFVDPVPQALTLTSIVIGACVTALALALVIRIKHHYQTLDPYQIRRLKG